MVSLVLYLVAFLLLIVSFLNNRTKTKMSLNIAWRSFSKLLPAVLAMMIFIGITLSILDENVISGLLGSESGVIGIIMALSLGSVISMPSFVAFPLGGALLNAGAGYMQVAALVSTIMSVGFVSLPIEVKYYTKAIAYRRIIFSFLICVIFTMLVGVVI